MNKWCYIVTILNLTLAEKQKNTEYKLRYAQETITRVFTKKEDAELFVEDCKKGENQYGDGYKWQCKILRAELDGNPLTGFFSVFEE